MKIYENPFKLIKNGRAHEARAGLAVAHADQVVHHLRHHLGREELAHEELADQRREAN